MDPSPGSVTPPDTERPPGRGDPVPRHPILRHPILRHRVLHYRLVAGDRAAASGGGTHRWAGRAAAGAGWVVALVAVGVYARTAIGYHVGSLRRPGPGLFPLVAVTVLSVGLAGLALERRRTPPAHTDSTAGPDAPDRPDGTDAADGADGLDWASPLRLAAILVLSIGYVLLTPALGDLASGTAFAVGVLLVMGNPLWLTVLGGLALGLGSHYLFVTVLGLPLGHGSGF